RAGRERVVFLLDRGILLDGGFPKLALQKLGKIVRPGRRRSETGEQAQDGNKAEACHHSPLNLPVKAHFRLLPLATCPIRPYSPRFRTARPEVRENATGSGGN